MLTLVAAAISGLLIGAGVTGYVATSKKSKVEEVVEDVAETVEDSTEAFETDEFE